MRKKYSYCYTLPFVLIESLESNPLNNGCQTHLGVAGKDVSSIDGTVKSYGYVHEYFGHADVLMVYVDGEWTAVTNAIYDEAKGTFTFNWKDAYVEY